jgi:hypothetical protein
MDINGRCNVWVFRCVRGAVRGRIIHPLRTWQDFAPQRKSLSLFCCSFVVPIFVAASVSWISHGSAVAQDATNGHASRDDELSTSLIAGVLEAQNAVRRYDVVVRRWCMVTPNDPEREGETQPKEENSTWRYIVDLDKEICFVVSQQSINYHSTSNLPGSLRESRELWFYSDGKYSKRVFTHARQSLKPMITDFESFWEKEYIDNPPFMGALAVLLPNNKPAKTFIQDFIVKHNNAAVFTLPDGMFRVIASIDGSRSYRLTSWIDPKMLTVIKRSTTVKEGESWKPTYQHDVRYLEMNACCVPISISFSSHNSLRSSINHEKRVRADQVGTVSLNWLIVNGGEIVLPEISDFGSDASSWEKFLNPEGANSSRK